jgi:hypothetical protein
MSGNPLVRFDEGRVGRALASPSLLLYQEKKNFTPRRKDRQENLTIRKRVRC